MIPAPPPVVTIQRPNPAQALLDMRGNSRTRARPSTVPQDVWSIVEEYRDKGGLFDLTVQIARLESEFRNIEKLRETSDVLPAEAQRMRMKLTVQIAQLQAKAVEVAIKTEDFITTQGLKVIMGAVFTSMTTHGVDAHTINKVGQDVAQALKALKAQVKT